MPPLSLKNIVRPAYRKAVNVLPPRWNIIFDFVRFHHRWPDLENPKTFNEKIAWRKLYDRNPRLPDLVDKIKAKEIVAAQFGREFVIPTLAVFDAADRLDFDASPLSKPPYVLKTNHGSGMNVFVKERPANPDQVRRKLARFLKTDYHEILEEWAYSRVDRKILAEPLIETPEGYIPDYKFHVFDGTVFAIELVIDRFKGYWINLYDRSWKLLDIRVYAKRPRYEGPVPPPSRLADMIGMAEALGKDFPYVRVDLYQVGNAIKFGEMTFYPGGGHDKFEPPEWDETFGRQWKQDWAARPPA